jgi:hypothetical protein
VPDHERAGYGSGRNVLRQEAGPAGNVIQKGLDDPTLRIAALAARVAIQSAGLLQFNTLPRWQSSLFLIGVLLVGTPDGLEIINLFSVMFFLLAAWALCVRLKPVNRDLALIFLLFNLAGFAVWFFSSLCLFGSLVILNGVETIKAFQPDQLQVLAVFIVSLFKNGVYIA